LGAELLQFAVLVAVFVVVAVLWLFIVFIPARTLERWEDQRPGHGGGRARPDEERGPSDRSW
jgi:threonine/homoserine/homoserine lactone efflux protein